MDMHLLLNWLMLKLLFQCSPFLCFIVVVGGAEEIHWFSPNGEKIVKKHVNLKVLNHGNSLSSLIVLNAKLNNAGIYKCVARNGDMESQATVKLDILCKYLP